MQTLDTRSFQLGSPVQVFANLVDPTLQSIDPFSIVMSGTSLAPCLLDVERRRCFGLSFPEQVDSASSFSSINPKAFVSIDYDSVPMIYKALPSEEFLISPRRLFVPRRVSNEILPRGSNVYPMRPTNATDKLIESLLYTLPGEIGSVLISPEGQTESLWRVSEFPGNIPSLARREYLGSSTNASYFCLFASGQGYPLAVETATGRILEPPLAYTPTSACSIDKLGAIVTENGFIASWNSTMLQVHNLENGKLQSFSEIEVPVDETGSWEPVAWVDEENNSVSVALSREYVVGASLSSRPDQDVVPSQDLPDTSSGSGLNRNVAIIGLRLFLTNFRFCFC